MWIKEPKDDYETISGTVVMMVNGNSVSHTETVNDDSVDLKQTSTGVILNPQPQDNPNDPLNWPVWRRDIGLLTVTIYALLAGGMTPLLAPVMKNLEIEFNKPYHSVTYFVGILMASMGVGSAILAPIAVKYGKRLVYLVALLIFFGGLCWGANANSYGSLMGARVLSGFGASAAESLPSTTIAEIYFAHERAYRLGIYTLLLLGGKNLSPLASAFTANRLGWHWIFWVAAIICAGTFVLTFLFVHETFWDRAPIPNARSQQESEAAQRARENLNLPPWEPSIEGVRVDSTRRQSQTTSHIPPPFPTPSKPDEAATEAANRGDHADNNAEADAATVEATLDGDNRSSSEEPGLYTNTGSENRNDSNDEENPYDVKRTPFFQNLTIYSGKKTEARLWMIFLRPFVLYSYLPVLYATVIYGTSVVWLSVIAETINTIFSAAPYHFKSTSVGLLYIATFLGGVIGSMIAGKVSDFLVRWMSSRNGGIYEPEFRLVMILPVLLSVTIGLMGFGWSTFEKDLWIVPAIFLGVLGFGTSLASTVSITYVVDCYRVYALESLVSLNVAKNILGLAFSIFVPYFFDASGSKTSFVVYGCIEIALCLFAIPLYHYGKVIRRWHDTHRYIDALYLNRQKHKQ